jgi:hypothetical protein
MAKLELAGYSPEAGFGRALINAVEAFSVPVSLRLRELLVNPVNGSDMVKPAAWRVQPGSVEVVTLVNHPDAQIRPETLARLALVEEALSGINWTFRLMKVAKSQKFCAEVDLRSARITTKADRT